MDNNQKIFIDEIYIHKNFLINLTKKKYTQDIDEINDLVQETFIKAFRYINNYERGSNAKGWLYAILRNNFINEYRANIKHSIIINDENGAIMNLVKDKNKLPFDDSFSDEVTKALNRLPNHLRIITILDIDGFTYDEISKIINIPIGTVRSRIHRSRKLLRKMLSSLNHKTRQMPQ